MDFENPTFDPEDVAYDDYDFPDLPTMDPPLDVQQQLNTSGDLLQNLRDELRQAELEAQKERLVDTFYNEVNRAYGLRPEGRIDYSQFGIDDDGKTLYWTPDDKKIPISATRGGFRFLALSTLATRYGKEGAYALRRSLGLIGYRSGISRLVETLQNAEETLPKNIGAEGPLRRDSLGQREMSQTIDDPPMDRLGDPGGKELAGVDENLMAKLRGPPEISGPRKTDGNGRHRNSKDIRE